MSKYIKAFKHFNNDEYDAYIGMKYDHFADAFQIDIYSKTIQKYQINLKKMKLKGSSQCWNEI